MTSVRYFKPHPLAATVRIGGTWWWPAQDGAHYAAIIVGDARYTGLTPYTYRDGHTEEFPCYEYELLFFRLNPDDWHTSDDIFELGNKPRRPVRDAYQDGRCVTSWRLSELNAMGIGIVDTLWRQGLMWRQTPADEKGLRQMQARDAERDHERGGRRGRNRRWEYATKMKRKKDSYRRKTGRDLDRGVQETRGFKLPTPQPRWTPDDLELLAWMRSYR